MENKIPSGLALVSWYFSIGGVLSIIVGLAIPVFMLIGSEAYGDLGAPMWTLVIVISLFVIALGVFYLLVSRGLRRAEPWSRIAGIVLSALGILVSILLFFIPGDFGGVGVDTLISFAVVIYLITKKELFI